MERAVEQFAEVCFRKSAETAHDLKTPLNIAVLNLELLRMRARRLGDGNEDEKLADYAKAIETELRRMARIFDAFFVFSVPPKSADQIEAVDPAPLLQEALRQQNIATEVASTTARISSFKARVQELFRQLATGARLVMTPESLTVVTTTSDDRYRVTLSGVSVVEDVEVEKLFKFYFTDPAGSPDLSLATARLIADTLGGELAGERQDNLLKLELSLPSGER